MGKAKVKENILKIKPYVPGTSVHDLGRPIVKLSSNENPYGPSPKVVEAINRAAGQVHLYPDKESRDLRSKLSEALRIPPGCIATGNGSDDVLENLVKLFMSEGDNLVTHSSFSTYQTIARTLGAECRLVSDLPDFRIDTKALMDACDGRTRILLICTPNNPTGVILDQGQIDSLLGFTGERGIFLVIDEAYSEFSERYTSPAERIVREDLDAAVTRTFSKAYGLAGLRIGYSIAPERIIRHLDLVRMPFNASSLAQAAAVAALGDKRYVETTVEKIRRGRAMLAEKLSSLGLNPLPSEANFILVSVSGLGYTAKSFTQALLERGYAVRDCSSFGLPDYIRITVGTEDQNSSFISALESLLS